MGWFNVVKGAYPAIDMVTLDRPIEDSAAGRLVVRGSVMVLTSNTFRVTTESTDKATTVPAYFALQPATDMNAAMAGTISRPKITGIPCNYPMEVETDQYDTAGTYAIGTMLMTGDTGTVTNRDSGQTAIGIVTAIPFRRWVNDAVAVAGYRTGNNVSVIRFMTCFLPVLT